MSFAITDRCIGCWACAWVCPNGAVHGGDGEVFLIDARRCTECAGEYAEPQCASICPVEEAIIDAVGRALNPPGSLTGIRVNGVPVDPGVRLLEGAQP